jgi:hypothetical protein
MSVANHKAYVRLWYAKNRESVLAKMKAWRMAHLEEARAYEREMKRKSREAKRVGT